MTAPAAGERILVVEDEPAIADNIVYALETEGFLTEWVQFGVEAERRVRDTERPIALAILDVGLPDANGFELCKAIRKHSDVPIVFLTARDDEVDRIVGLEIGADDYIVKPFSPRELSARVKSILRRTRGGGGSSGDNRDTDAPREFEWDSAGKRVRYRGQLLDLTKSEYRILELLLRQPERVHSRQQIMDAAWDEPEMSQERAVDTHIKSLRAKLREVDRDRDPIRTHRGLGYSLSGRVREL